MSSFKKYRSISNRSLQKVLAYRTSYIINLAANFVNLLAIYFLWQGIYGGREELGGYTWDQMKTYLLITFLANSVLSWYSETAISGKILDGSVAADLLKPIDFQSARFAETLGSSLLEGGMSAVIIGAFILFTPGINLPHSPLIWVFFVLSLFAAMVVKFGIVYLAALLCFWSTGSLGIVWARIAITNLLSGALVPLVFFPGWLEKLAMVLPFQSIIHTPTVIFLQQVGALDMVKMIGVQCFWGVALWIAGKLMWNWAVRQVTIHGG
ncbi:ABC-2 type transport system permease protein [Paenibacillus anaericanus]|uniref:ABC transporter permease n=1 Tax=Paenibacillus anaericanus TaxID=170367 RepID=UPI0027832CCE|nr:ABC-2 family transporter protein [Paenibacillus anaericanus]MDQ0090318.1 ABC-2 type transport system permease protein [Paenibacillus anaericanus]